MADPTRAPWIDAIKSRGQLTIGLDGSLGKAGWDRAFRDAIPEFNKLSATHRLGVTFVRAEDPGTADVQALAARGDFDFEYPPQIPKKKIRFDGTEVHGLCKPLLTQVTDRRTRVDELRLMKAFIYVPAAPLTDKQGPRGRRSRQTGDRRP